MYYNSFEKKCMLLGYIKNNIITYLPEHLDKNELIKLEKDDSLIYIKY